MGGNTFGRIYPKQSTLGRKSITRLGVIFPFIIVRLGAFISLYILTYFTKSELISVTQKTPRGGWLNSLPKIFKNFF